MKAETTFGALQGVTRALKPFVGRPTVPAMEAVRIAVECDRLTLGVFDYDTNARASFWGADISDGVAYVSHALLTAALAGVKPAGRGAARAIVTLSGEADYLTISCDGQTATVPTLPADDMPAQPLDNLPTVDPIATIPAGTLADITGRVIGAAAGNDMTRPILGMLNFRRDRGAVLTVQATDTYRAHRVTFGPVPDGGEAWNLATDIDVDARTLAAVARLVTVTGGGDVAMSRTFPAAVFESSAVQVHTRNIGQTPGAFPKIETLFDNRAETTRARVDSTWVQHIAQRANKITEKLEPVRLTVDVDARTLTATIVRDGAELFRSTCPLLDASGDDVTQGFNAGYLADAMEACADAVTLGFIAGKPLRFESDGVPVGCGRMDGLIMPIRLA